MTIRSWTMAVAVAASGCASIAQPDAPARIVSPSVESRADLREAVTSALGRTDVTLADDALTDSSVLVIERTPARDSTGQRLSGRDYDKPEQFDLVISGKRCTLVHQRTGERYELRRTRCAAQRG